MAAEKTVMFVTNCACKSEGMDPVKAHEYIDEVLDTPRGLYSTLEKAKAAMSVDVKVKWTELIDRAYNGELEWRKIKRLHRSNKLWCYEAAIDCEMDEGDFSIVARIFEMRVDASQVR